MTSRNGGPEPLRDSAYEKRLVARLQSGEAEALNTLYELHIDRLFAYARHLLGNREDAEEITSETFLRAFTRIASFRGECPFRGWLFAIARNLCLDRLNQPKLLTLEPDEAERESDAGRQSAQMETSALVRQAMSELPEDYRLTLLLCDVEGWDAREAAAIQEKSLAATKSMLYRARRLLRERLTALWGDEDDQEHRE